MLHPTLTSQHDHHAFLESLSCSFLLSEDIQLAMLANICCKCQSMYWPVLVTHKLTDELVTDRFTDKLIIKHTPLQACEHGGKV